MKQIQYILAQMDNEADIEALFIDLFTQKERDEFARRFEVARRLQAGETYKSIESSTGMSSTTIARIASFLQSNSGGYQRAIALLSPTANKHHEGHL